MMPGLTPPTAAKTLGNKRLAAMPGDARHLALVYRQLRRNYPTFDQTDDPWMTNGLSSTPFRCLVSVCLSTMTITPRVVKACVQGVGRKVADIMMNFIFHQNTIAVDTRGGGGRRSDQRLDPGPIQTTRIRMADPARHAGVYRAQSALRCLLRCQTVSAVGNRLSA